MFSIQYKCALQNCGALHGYAPEKLPACVEYLEDDHGGQYIAMSCSLKSKEFTSSALHVSLQGVPVKEGTRRSCVFWSRAE